MNEKLKLLFFSQCKIRLNLIVRCLCVIILLITPQLSIAENPESGGNKSLPPQPLQVTGTITDASTGQTLPGASVVIEGTTTGVITDAAGKYAINVPNSNAVLVVSFVGYETRRIAVGGMTVIDIALSAGLTSIDEVVVVGYGSVKKSDLTGSLKPVRREESRQIHRAGYRIPKQRCRCRQRLPDTLSCLSGRTVPHPLHQSSSL